MNEISKLLKLQSEIKYPADITPLRGKIGRVSFFPGGKGTYDNSDAISDKDIMILGQDWGNISFYSENSHDTIIYPEKDATWRYLLAFLGHVKLNIDPFKCFFTNAIMGARSNEVKITGRSPAFKYPEFIDACRNFFLMQIQVQQPKVILVLGINTARFLSDTAPGLRCWNDLTGFKQIQDDTIQVRMNVAFNNNIVSNLALLMHPSFRNVNLRHRIYQGLQGNDAEVQMVRDALIL